ncbi:tRNA pseudouridine(55) synthase TruB [bacterium]|nr:tRNA pseudouridine(55) synthase TruB [bacterium]
MIKRGTLTEPTGLWLVDKPYKKSSFWAVHVLRKFTGIKKVGHAGTLDPLATGLLLVLVGKEYTCQVDSFLKLDKEYELEITFGANSSTDDLEGEMTAVSSRRPSTEEVETVIKQLTGRIMQTPPIYSAMKVGGQRAYKLARQGASVELQSRPVEVYGWIDVHYEYPLLKATVAVSSGTYIRSLARDLGEMLDTGAYLSALRRTKIGEYSVQGAVGLENLLSI